ncbi:MAG: permease [Candidatus Latescibacteria bacterium]|nr:permease [Candidatus Latescibacterota bacterium]
MRERTKLLLIVGTFLACFFVPFGSPKVEGAILEMFHMLREYAREHVLTCLVPAFFIAGAIAVFLSQGAVMKYLGAEAKKVVAYSVASVSGTILAVCSCTVLPLFAGIYKRGAGLGPASAFLYSGPAINVLAIVLTARVLGWEIGLARAAGAVVFALVIGLLMALIFRKEEAERAAGADPFGGDGDGQPISRAGPFVAAMVGLLIFAAWGRPAERVGFAEAIWQVHWYLAGAFLLLTVFLAFRWFDRDAREEWVQETWGFVKLILPLLFAGVMVAGLLLGRPGTDAGLIPAEWIEGLVGGNSLFANLFASLSGALMYFATLTEVPILQGLLGQGMGKGPALALLLAGPALSLPNLLVIRGVLGTKKTLTYAGLVVVLSTVAGVIYGGIAG